ncbi:hypothetical protein [Acinetobacter sp. YH12112]|uniref:hypothetical protein n=1 Tax=Acinetobacter sp. YH12112 TaxID=2601099 RepID=UPI0015D45E38|nr:hypothetical protein [Acinetobacter sp. YH12112]
MAGLVKHYQNTMKGIPQLTNNWGAMINLLDAVLVNGFNHVTILGITKANTTSITATINLGSDHGFIDRQVVRIAGSTNGWDGDYKVLSADTSSITVECTAEHPSNILGTASCFTAPLDFEIVYQTQSESTESKRAYRSTDPESLGLILLVHDFCVSGASSTGAKFAKVGIVSDMSDIDTITGSQMPFDPGIPNANWGWDGTYHGWAKWYYKTANGAVTYYADTASPSNSGAEFYIVGDGVSFILDVKAADTQPVYTVGGICEFVDATYLAKNLALIAQGVQNKIAQNYSYFQQGRNPILWTSVNNSYIGKVDKNLNISLWNNDLGIQSVSNASEGWCLLKPSIGINSVTSSDTAFFSKFVISDTNGKVRGILPFLRISSLATTTESFDSGVGKYVSRYYQLASNQIFIKHVILMEQQ